MRGNGDGHRKECHGVQSSSSVDIGCHSSRERPFSLGWCLPNVGRHHECEVEASARKPTSSDVA
eukprot:248593-Pelagomonas_calceolata.AAC.1